MAFLIEPAAAMRRGHGEPADHEASHQSIRAFVPAAGRSELQLCVVTTVRRTAQGNLLDRRLAAKGAAFEFVDRHSTEAARETRRAR